MILHGIQNMCLHCYIIDENHLCLHKIQRKSGMVYTVSRPIFETRKSSSKTVSLGFHDLETNFRDWAYGISKRIAIFAVK